MTATVVDIDARMPELPAIIRDPDLELGFDVAIDDLRESIRRMKKRASTHSRATMLTRVLSRVAEAKNADDPMGSLVQYLDELTAMQAEVRQVISTVGDLIDET